MELVRSNRTEDLAQALAARVRSEPLAPFAKEAVVVQSLGMQRWLTLELSASLGIWCNPFFPFTRKVVEQILDDLDAGPSEAAQAYGPSRLKWTIAELLHESPHEELRSYLGDPADPERVLRLADRVAKTFDRYVVHRMQMLREWQRGEDRGWQADLWRRIVERLGPHDLAARVEAALEKLRGGDGSKVRYSRIHLFSLETLPPLFVQLFAEVSRAVPTLLYLLEPSKEYVSDVDTSPQLSLPIAASPPSDGHPLLIHLGRLARDFQELLLALEGTVSAEHDLFARPERSSLLRALQADVFEFRMTPAPSDRTEVQPDDRSIEIHECTGPMREAQVLHDRIRAALEDDPSLCPEDIVVMTPDLDTYAPLFRAVFGQPDPRRIPHEVHDRRTREDASFYDDFDAVLEVVDSRFSALDVLRLIDATSLRAPYRFQPEERARLAEMLEQVGVRWGVDGAHREELGFPNEPVHTWRAALGRLFLGFAQMPGSTDVFEGSLPRGAPSLGDAELVARLAQLCEQLFDFRQKARAPLPIEDWAVLLEGLCSALFGNDDENSAAVRVLREALEEMTAASAQARYAHPVSLSTMRRELAASIRLNTPAVGFLSRGVTLSELVPLRSVPFRVVCLLGMGEEAFPRTDDRPSFDRTRFDHQQGDRNRRDDDRHSFLQAVLCARDRLIITYGAPSARARDGVNPSPVVWELRETADRFYRRANRDHVLEPVVHPVHAFDPRYFEAGELPASSSSRQLEIARAIREPPSERARAELSVGAEDAECPDTLSSDELSKWLWNPAKEFLERLLGARFERTKLYEPTHALTELTPLAASRVGSAAFEAGLRGDDLERYLRAAPELPDGTTGALRRFELAREIELISRASAASSGGSVGESVRISTDVGGLSLEARLGGIHEARRVVARFAKPERRTELRTWIEHLLMHVTEATPCGTELAMRGDDKRAPEVVYSSPEHPGDILSELVSVYRESRTNPLPLFESASWAFAAASDAGFEKARKAARDQLAKQREYDPRLDYVLGLDDPFANDAWAERFADTAVRVYGPLLRHRQER